jgi:Zn-dependent M28 family amino/carboxypeptidase
LTVEFLAKELKAAGVAPAGADGSYFQPVPLMKISTGTKATLQAKNDSFTLDIPIEEGFAGTSQTQVDKEAFDAEVIFVGHGINAPEFEWNDYNDVDVKGKVVVLFTNEPSSEDPKFFGGSALTYYGRWTFKYEEAARRGAKACFIVHTNETAGYPYSVVRNLDGAQLARDPGTPALAFAGWLSRKAGEQLFAKVGKTVDEALKDANTKGFKPYTLGFNFKADIPVEVKKFTSSNVVGIVEGSDPVLKSEVVVFTAHWDHLGVGRAVLGDTIYNGAADNATGSAIVLELARAWATQKVKPKRSALFLLVTAEEKGLLGSKYYAQKPLIPLSKTALNLNFDMVYPGGVPKSVVLTGSERTTFRPTVEAVVKEHGLEIEKDQRGHLGIFYRSDHFSMARAGVPAFSIAPGMNLENRSADSIKAAMQKFNDQFYHTPQDVIQDDWDFSGYPVLGKLALRLASEAANAAEMPTWVKGDEFYKPRSEMNAK